MAKTLGILWLQLPVTVLLLISHLRPALANEQQCEGEACGYAEDAAYPDEDGQGSSSPSGLPIMEAVAGSVGEFVPQRTHGTHGNPDLRPSSPPASTTNGASKPTGISQKSSSPSSTYPRGSDPQKATAAASKSSGMPTATPSKSSSARVASSSKRSPPRLQAKPASRRIRRRRGR
uniref:Putative secreted mucin n=1 Tax=Amblyomma parvum TaxID=251391 RepID=A0A023G0L9_AMBPA